MENKKILQRSLLSALGAAAYIMLVAWFMTNMETAMGSVRGFLGPVAILLLFVVSAAVTGALVLGKPVLLYMEGAKREALEFFGFTVCWLIVFFFLVLVGAFALGS